MPVQLAVLSEPCTSGSMIGTATMLCICGFGLGTRRLSRALLPRHGGAVLPMLPPEIAQYVFERLYRVRGSDALRARCAAALDAIGEASGGIPRAVNVACERLVERPDAAGPPCADGGAS